MSIAGAIKTARVSGTRLSSRKRPAALMMTEKATIRLKSLLSGQSEGYSGVRLGVKTRGCSGLSYTLDFAKAPEKFDEVVEDGGVTVYIDPRALMYVVGTEMDWVESPLQSEFVFYNPNATGTCGCGESFAISKEELINQKETNNPL